MKIDILPQDPEAAMTDRRPDIPETKESVEQAKRAADRELAELAQTFIEQGDFEVAQKIGLTPEPARTQRWIEIQDVDMLNRIIDRHGVRTVAAWLIEIAAKRERRPQDTGE